jgi:DNA (cytosine-5)-methyltransferase 1
VSAPVAIDLFAGAGGLSLGLTRAGFDVRVAAEQDAIACATYRHNFGDAVYEGDLSQGTPQALLDLGGLSPDDVDLVAGGPPCQGFSLQRRGHYLDARNELVVVFIELALALRPAAIVMENVPAILGPRGIREREICASRLDAAGFAYEWRVLQASDFGVPQDRRRAFLVAWDRERMSGFNFPAPGREGSMTVSDAISDLPEPPRDFTPHPLHLNHVRVKMSELNLRRIAHIPYGGGRLDLPAHLQLPCHRKSNGHRHLDVFGRMRWDRPAPTITAMFDNFTRGRFAHPVQDRNITAREGARIQTFPDEFLFVGPKKTVARQIGNAVPPRLAEAVGEALMTGIRSARMELKYVL